MVKTSPITGSSNTKLIKGYDTCITSDSRIVNERADKHICLDTGLIFNATGPRGGERDFYTDDYELHAESDSSEFKYFDTGSAAGIYDEIVDFIRAETEFGAPQEILDVGCGKGILLRKLKEKYPKSVLHGVEPSRNAQGFFKKTFPEVSFFEGPLEASPFVKERFDLIVSNGVLEHVPDPVSFLRIIRNSIKKDGYLYIGVPNFTNNPADILTYDHLSHFTPETVSIVFALAGFEVLASKVMTQRVPMWFVLKRTEEKPLSEIDVDINKSWSLAQDTLGQVNAYFKSYDKAAQSAKSKRKRVAVYGTGAFAMIATRHTQLDVGGIAMFLDDNKSMWDSERLGVPVCDPHKVKARTDISEIIISANPCYLRLIVEKLSKLLIDTPITVHVPKI